MNNKANLYTNATTTNTTDYVLSCFISDDKISIEENQFNFEYQFNY